MPWRWMTSGNIYDPYAGQADLEAKLLRHVSSAFREDPLRVLRVARFGRTLCSLWFSNCLGNPTNMMQEMVQSGELNTLNA